MLAVRQTDRQADGRAHLIGLLGPVGGLQGADEALGHQQQEARHAVQRVAVDLRLGDDRLGLGPAGDGCQVTRGGRGRGHGQGEGKEEKGMTK